MKRKDRSGTDDILRHNMATKNSAKKLMTRSHLWYENINISHEIFFFSLVFSQRIFYLFHLFCNCYFSENCNNKTFCYVTTISVGLEKIATVYFFLTRLRIFSQFLLHESKDRIFYSVMNNDNLIWSSYTRIEKITLVKGLLWK